jgi:hypothetical protein
LEDEKLNGLAFGKILVENVVSSCVDESRDEKRHEKFEVGRESASWEMEGTCKEI